MSATKEKPNGVVIVTRGWRGRMLMIPNTGDNRGKKERTSDMEPLNRFVPVEGYQFMGGGVETGETPEGAAIREIKEEGGLMVRGRQLIDAPYGLTVEQINRGEFGVQVFELQLNLLQELWLRLARGAKVTKITRDVIRQRDLNVMQLAEQSITVEEYEKINST